MSGHYYGALWHQDTVIIVPLMSGRHYCPHGCQDTNIIILLISGRYYCPHGRQDDSLSHQDPIIVPMGVRMLLLLSLWCQDAIIVPTGIRTLLSLSIWCQDTIIVPTGIRILPFDIRTLLLSPWASGYHHCPLWNQDALISVPLVS